MNSKPREPSNRAAIGPEPSRNSEDEGLQDQPPIQANVKAELRPGADNLPTSPAITIEPPGLASSALTTTSDELGATVGGETGEIISVVCGAWNERIDIATLVVRSQFVPDLREVAQAYAKIQAGRELGIGPFMSLIGIDVTKGKLAISANLMAGLIRRSPHYDYRSNASTTKRTHER